MGQWKYFSRN
uniref:CWF19 like cell cycle control factor 2 n=1 Tax=Pipistrellus kuhlii TaxID=59472 RepID=A0A7J7X005_PIPKU|nr:CWF19 like cell cycle control factor 2 [Pipistrellus kuhlii]